MTGSKFWRLLIIAAMCFPGLACATPAVIPLDTVQSQPAHSGLRLLIEVDLGDTGPNPVLHTRVNAIGDSVRSSLRRANIGYVDLAQTGRSVSFTVRNPTDLDKARAAVRQIDSGVEVRTTGNTITLTLTDRAMRDQKRAAMEQLIEVLHRRVDPDGVKQAVIRQQGENRILVQVPGEHDAERLKTIIRRPAKVAFRLVNESVTPEEARAGRLPPTDELLPGDKKDRDAAGQPNQYVVEKQVMVSGASLIDAKRTADPNSGGPVVSFRFDSAGARQFGQATKGNIGKRFAIVLDNEVISAPVIREPITGGSGIISGRFTTEEVDDLARLLRAGSAPAPLKVLEEREPNR
jgi:preprotein translocase subunit SecD